MLGDCYRLGAEMLKNEIEGAKWYRKAAEQGNAEAQSLLGACYWEGQGVPKDYVLAYMWLNLSAAAGDALAQKARESVEKKMSPEQITEAQRMCREWKPKKETTGP